MYLFTTPPATTRETGTSRDPVARSVGNSGVVDAIREGAQTSGAGFDYLLATAKRESGLDPSAKAGTSSATGLFQFIEQTWLGVMKNAGPRLGLASYADAITAKSDGSYAVQDPAARQSILDLRRDPTIAATMAGALTQANRDSLANALGREPTGGDLYAAHVLGARGAASLINTAQASPARAAALDMPEAAAANRNLFYDKAGRPRGAAELYALLSTSQNTGAAGASPIASSVTDLPSGATAYASLDGGGLRSMFQTDRRQGAVSDGVAKLWQGRGAAEAARKGPSYFPRSDAAMDSVPVEAAAIDPAASDPGTVSVALVGSPMPPRRPAEFTPPASRQAGALIPSLYTTRSGP